MPIDFFNIRILYICSKSEEANLFIMKNLPEVMGQ